MPVNLAVIKETFKKVNRCPSPHLTVCRLYLFLV
jgi:hypothetical protein